MFSRNPTSEYFQEVQIRLRHTMKPHSCTGYEVFFRCLKTEDGYAEIVRWDGAVGNWTSLKRFTGPEYGVEDGDLIEATIEGNVLKGFINGVEVISATDDTYPRAPRGSGSTSASRHQRRSRIFILRGGHLRRLRCQFDPGRPL